MFVFLFVDCVLFCLLMLVWNSLDLVGFGSFTFVGVYCLAFGCFKGFLVFMRWVLRQVPFYCVVFQLLG